MKLINSIIVGALFVSSSAYAQTEWIARAPNKAGGTIVMLTFKGQCREGLRLYASTSGGQVSWGCWLATDNHVMVFWDEGEQRTSAFPYDMFELNPAQRKPAPAQNRGNNF